MPDFAIMVTGGAGYIGSHAVLALADAGRRVVVIDSLVTGFRAAVDERAVFVEGDVADDALVRATLREHGIGAILHFAGSVVVPESVADPLKYYRNNTAASRALIEAAVGEGVRHFIFSSTAAVYGIPEAIPVAEDAPTRPINPYGASKLMTETMLRDVAAAHPFNYAALRYFNVAGADPAGRSGQSTAGATHLIKVAVEAALGKRPEVAVFGRDFPTADGTGVRDYIHVADLIDAHLLALDALVADPGENLLLNCGYGRGFSVLEVLESVARVSGRPVPHRFADRRAGDPDALVADNRAILARLPWQPRRAELDRIVADALAWEAKLGPDGPGRASDPVEERVAEARRSLAAGDRPRAAIGIARSLAGDGHAEAAERIYREILALWPRLPEAANAVSKFEDAKDAPIAAAKVLLPALEAPGAPPWLYRRGQMLARKGGDLRLMEHVCTLALEHLPGETWPIEAVVKALMANERSVEALAFAERFWNTTTPDASLALAVYAAAYRIDSPKAHGYRARALESFAAAANPALWEARLARMEFRIEAAFERFEQAVACADDRELAVRDLAGFAVGHGQIGPRAGVILEAEATASPDLSRAIGWARELLAARGGTLEEAAAGEGGMDRVTSPAAAFELVCRGTAVAAAEGDRHSLLMIGGSLAAGGAERIVATMFARHRLAFGSGSVELCLFDLSPESDSAFYLALTGAEHTEILRAQSAEPSHPAIRWLPKTMAVRTQALYDHMLALRPAVVHATCDMANACAGYAAILAGVPRVLLHIHNMRPTELAPGMFQPDFETCYRELIRRPEVTLVGVSRATIADYLDWMRIEARDEVRAVTVHNGFDFSPFSGEAPVREAAALRTRLGLGPEGQLVGTAFRFAELKRPLWWVDMAIAICRVRPHVQFILFGDGDMREEAETRARASGFGERIHFPGRVSNLHELVGALDLFVLTSRTEGLPNVLIEAQAAGVAVATFDVGGAPDTLLDGITGVVMREQTQEALDATVLRLLDDRGWLSAAGTAAAAHVRETFSIDRMMEEMNALIGLADAGREPVGA